MPCTITCWCAWVSEVSRTVACGAACRTAVLNAVTRMARPSDPPTCWVTLTMLDAAPESCGCTPASEVMVSGTNATPIPPPSSSIGPRTPDR